MVGQGGVELVDDASQLLQPVRRREDRDQGPVDGLERAVDHVVLLLEPVEDRAQGRVAAAQVREDRGVLERVVGRDQAAVGLAVGAEGPLVLPHGHLVDRTARGRRVQGAGRHLVDEVVDLAQLRPEVVVDVDEVPPRPRP